MSKRKTDYSTSCIYKLFCLDTNITDIYIGSCVSIDNRKRCHKCTCINADNKDYNLKVYNFIRDNGGWNNWDIVKIEDYPCTSKKELLKRETELMLELKATLNCRYAQRTHEQYYKDNKDILTEYRKNWKKNNKEKIKKNGQIYYKENKEKIKQYVKDNKVKINRKRREKNKNNKFVCGCGSVIAIYGKNRHFKSLKHLAYLESTNSV